MKDKNGQGKFFVDPPEDFIPKEFFKFKNHWSRRKQTPCQETFSDDFILKNNMIKKHTHERRQAFVSECFENVQQHMV